MARRRPRPLPGDVASARQGLSEAMIAHQLEAQAWRCLVCGQGLGQAWAADHDHALAEQHGHAVTRGCQRCFRGLLCRSCNLMLGFARDQPEVLEAGAHYLRLARG